MDTQLTNAPPNRLNIPGQAIGKPKNAGSNQCLGTRVPEFALPFSVGIGLFDVKHLLIVVYELQENKIERVCA